MINYNLNQKLTEWNSLFMNWKNLQSQLKAKYKITHGGVFSSLSKRPLIWDLVKSKYFTILFVFTIFLIFLEFNLKSFEFFGAFKISLILSLVIAYFLGRIDQSKYDEKMKLILDVDIAFDLANNLLENDINVNYDKSNDPDGSEFDKSIEPYLYHMKEFMEEKERRETQSNAITNHLMSQADRSFESASTNIKNTDDYLKKIAGEFYNRKKQ